MPREAGTGGLVFFGWLNRKDRLGAGVGLTGTDGFNGTAGLCAGTGFAGTEGLCAVGCTCGVMLLLLLRVTAACSNF